MFDVIKEVLISKKVFTKTNYKRSFGLHKNNLIDSNGNMYWMVDSLIQINWFKYIL